MKWKFLFIFFAIPFLLVGCAEKTSFKKGDIKDDFCGAHLNFQYCKCAFHNEYCDNIGMSKSAAKDYVYEQYDKWVAEEFEKFENNCQNTNGVIKSKKGVEGENIDEANEDNNKEEGGWCKYDSDCDSICEGDVMWKMGCNARSNICEKTFDTDCVTDMESFGELSFSKICNNGECTRNTKEIEKTKADLIREKEIWSQTLKDINSSRDNIREAMMEANKNCINGIADMTNVAIIEFSTRIASVLAGGIPDIAAMTASAAEKAGGLLEKHVENLAGAAVDYAGEALNRLYNYQSGEPQEEERKLKPHEYIKLNCDLYNYFKEVQAESDIDLDIVLENAREVDSLLQVLP